jgi:hypothetical protein
MGKTTNERFAKGNNSSNASERSDSSRASSHTSSMVSVSLSLDLNANENGAEGIKGRCGVLGNCFDMCCNHQMVDQVKLFKN